MQSTRKNFGATLKHVFKPVLEDPTMPHTFEHLKLSSDKGVSTVTLSRIDKMNSLSMALRDEIEACFDHLAADADTGSVILTGGEDTFCPGFDIAEVVDAGEQAFTHRILEYHTKIYEFHKPIVAAVSGFALAGGFDLALCGDIIIASDTAIFGHPEIRFGVNPLVTPLWRKVGPSKAAELAMTGETIGAEEAHRIGLVSKVVPAEKLLEEAFEIARKLAKIDPRAIGAVKRAAKVVPGLDIPSGLEYEFGMSAAISADADIKANVEVYAKRLGLI
jgi:enoyl-CoA hydratase/carnithine racemase